MKTLILILVSSLSALAQLGPRVAITATFPDPQTALSAVKILADSKLAKPVDKLDVPEKVGTNQLGQVSMDSVTFYIGDTALADAKAFFLATKWAKGTVITFSHHLCPGTNDPPKGWLGCADDPRAQFQTVTLTP
jgi:hypothetical protein